VLRPNCPTPGDDILERRLEAPLLRDAQSKAPAGLAAAIGIVASQEESIARARTD